MSRKAINSRLTAAYDEMQKYIISEIFNVDYVCLTSDAWSSRNRGFLGITIHWLDQDFSRKSAVLSCQRFKGSHTYDKIASALMLKFEEYKIPLQKIVGVVTDNGSNFVKAFSEYGLKISDMECEEEANEDDDHLEIVDIHKILKESDDDSLVLPPHFRCAAHTLSLIASQEPLKVLAKKITKCTANSQH